MRFFGRWLTKVRKAIRGPIEPQLWFEDLVLLADLVSDTRRAAGVCADPNDDKYISAALEGRAAFVVTGDRQLLALGWICMVDPRAYLDILDS
jgi:predicted nucleic acid-binding protein